MAQFGSTARRKQLPDSDGTRILRELSANELDQLFEHATSAAASQALGRGLEVTGTDLVGRVVVTRSPIIAEQSAPTQPAKKT